CTRGFSGTAKVWPLPGGRRTGCTGHTDVGASPGLAQNVGFPRLRPASFAVGSGPSVRVRGATRGSARILCDGTRCDGETTRARCADGRCSRKVGALPAVPGGNRVGLLSVSRSLEPVGGEQDGARCAGGSGLGCHSSLAQ